ncbi:MAG: acyl-CoA dehydratase activase-related protein [Clostridium sp.]|nr:acyl-CoA dehydratase activase-related protein [Clostridium sp.]
MKIGIPKGLLYYKYYPFIETFFEELGVDIITSDNTNGEILNLGVKFCVDDACLPIKVFHGHVASLRNKCDAVLVPRFMSVKKGEYICPKFCGLPEMIKNSIDDLPPIITETIYGIDEKNLYHFAKKIGKKVNRYRVQKAFTMAYNAQIQFNLKNAYMGYKYKIALVGHPYNIYDKYVNMDIVSKLNKLNIGVITEEDIDKNIINSEISELYKKPFWYFARNSYGFASYVCKNNFANGIIYISSFACGIDSIVTELIRNKSIKIPMLTLKIDEQTGEAGFNTRLEAFTDMLERRCS